MNVRILKSKTANYLSLLVLLILFNCYEKKGEIKKDQEETPCVVKDSIPLKNTYKVDLQVNKINLSMYNNKYLLRVIPDSTFSKENMNYTILMTLKSDTIINYTINIDTINNGYYKYDKKGLENERINFKQDYYLSGIKIKRHWARAENLYLLAKMNSKKDTTERYVNLKFKYIGKEMGELYLNVY